MKISTWNVNSIRARIENLLSWLKETNPDIVLLQELKCTDDQFPILELSNLNYNIIYKGQKSYNGVAILSKYKLYDIKYDLPLYDIIDYDNDSRYIEAKFDIDNKTIRVASIYVPNGGPASNFTGDDITETDRFYNKMKFCDRLVKLFNDSIKNNEISFFGGDFNICPILEKDVYSVKKDGVITCTQKERDKFKNFLNIGMHDTFRELNEDLIEFSWWGYRPYFMFEKNQGFRLDAILTTDYSFKFVQDCYIEKKVRGMERPSDHAPMSCLLIL